MTKTLKLKRGLDLRIEGAVAPDTPVEAVSPGAVAVCPGDFEGFLPKMEVREGDAVAQGQPLMHDKNHPDIKLCAPIAGTVEGVVRGERRKILRVVVKASAGSGSLHEPLAAGGAQQLRRAMQLSGLWAEMRQRPYDIVPDPDREPRDIFVTAFDSAPLALPLEMHPAVSQQRIDAAVAALSQLTSGHLYVCTRKDFSLNIASPARHYVVEGPHPSGNAGVQAANIAPVNKGETVWTLSLVTLCRIGQLILEGRRGFDTVVGLCGSEVKHPHAIATVDGADIAQLVGGQLKDDGAHLRIISGNVLTGMKVDADGYLHFPYRQITVIPEGDDVDEFMGWASLSPAKMSVSRSFPFSRFTRRFRPDARMLGGHRSMIMSETADRVMPMDIMPEYLLKAIIAGDIDRMEALGIYEVAPEDFALAEYVDPSKTEMQRLVREGLDYLRKEIE
ncbi:MAG: Na(+)-translocating NADH-quinone reductase subunit A [Paramuribaculum sp.]|nr:Na(+)-translocating NADH-quinone reductase subunit A [Paramuribaculum sp.]